MRHLLPLALVISLSVLATSCSEDNDQAPRPTYQGPLLTTGQAGYNSGVLYAPGARILVGGNWYDEQLEISSDELASVFIGDSVYFFYSGIQDSAVTLSPHTSSQAMVLAWFATSGIDLLGYNSDARSHRLDTEWTLATGIEASSNESSTCLTNTLVRWAAVTSGGQQYYLKPARIPTTSDLLYGLWNSIIEATTSWGVHPETAVIANDVSAETFGSSFRIWLLPSSLYDEASLREAYAQNSAVMNQLNAMEVIECITFAIEKATGLSINRPGEVGNDCAQATVPQLVTLFSDVGGVFWLPGDAQRGERFMEWVRDYLEVFLVECVGGVVAGSLLPSEVAKIVGRVLSPFKALDFAIQGLNLAIGSYDTATSKFYAPLEPPVDGHWINIGPTPCTDVFSHANAIDGVGDDCVFVVHDSEFCRYCNGQWDSFVLPANASYVDFVSFDQAWMVIENSLVIWTPQYIDVQCGGMDTMASYSFESSAAGFWTWHRGGVSRCYYWNGVEWEPRLSRTDTTALIPPISKIATSPSGATYALCASSNARMIGLYSWQGLGWARVDSEIRPSGTTIRMVASDDESIVMNGVYHNDTYIAEPNVLLWNNVARTVLTAPSGCFSFAASSVSNVVFQCPSEFATRHWNGAEWRTEEYVRGAIMYELAVIGPAEAWAVAYAPSTTLLQYRPQ